MTTEFMLLGGGIESPKKTGAGKQTAYKRSIARFRDPLTPPQSKTECIHTIEPIPGVILCDGWRTFWRYMDVEYFILIRTPDQQDLQKILEGCLRDAAVAALLSALIAALITGGAAIPAAKAAFIAALLDCLKSHLTDVSVDIIADASWSDWS